MIKLYLALYGICLLFLIIPTKLSGQTIIINNPSLLNQTINANRSIENIEAGTDISRSYQSGTFYLDQMFYYGGFGLGVFPRNWKVSAEKSETNWHPDLNLFIRAIYTGVPNSTIFGDDRIYTADGTTIELINNNQNYTLIEGRGRVNEAWIEYEVEVPSVTIPAGTYSSNVTFTISAN